MDKTSFNQGLMDFINASPTPFHAVAGIETALLQAGFKRLDEGESWSVQRTSDTPNGYYIVRNDASLCAFTLTTEDIAIRGFRMLGAHTDSPCLKVKPRAEIKKKSYMQLGVEVYGGVLLNPWFDRDLSLAGRVSFQQTDGRLAHRLIDFKQPLAVIPSLAIHLDRDANHKRSINAQTDLAPILWCEDDDLSLDECLLAQLKKQYPDVSIADIFDYELSFYDVQPAAIIGLKQQFIASARLDNLLSCYTGLQALLTASQQPCLLIFTDHEEVGSISSSGAQGTLLSVVLERLSGSDENFSRLIHHSMLISTDNAHGVHPNFTDKHDDNHGPLLNQGPVIKINSNQRYASNSITSSIFRQCCQQADVPLQSFVMRSDLACGSTIGPLTASKIGVKTLDVGVPTFAMHSIRELAGCDDGWYLYRALHEFFKREQL